MWGLGFGIKGLWCRVWDPGLRVSGCRDNALGCKVWGVESRFCVFVFGIEARRVGFGVYGARCSVWCLGLRIWGLGSSVQDLGFRVQG